ncbi:hypothetical protein JCM14036_01820 [Desulfotomaculum defluvii]
MQTLTFGHEKLGPIVFQGEAENSLIYDRKIIQEIFTKGIEYLVSEELLTTTDQWTMQCLIDQMEVGIDENLMSQSLISYQVNQDNGEILRISYFIFPDTSRIPVVDMINTFLDDLCQIIVAVKYPKEKPHGAKWAEYAEFLLPSYYSPEIID